MLSSVNQVFSQVIPVYHSCFAFLMKSINLLIVIHLLKHVPFSWISKAFDRVWHKGLLFKLKSYGIDGLLFNLLESYLHNHKQRVVLNGQTSNWASVNAGVPQGSILGPLLFLIYINDLPDRIKSNVKLFADETSIFSVVNDTNVSCNELNEDLFNINKWAHK